MFFVDCYVDRLTETMITVEVWRPDASPEAAAFYGDAPGPEMMSKIGHRIFWLFHHDG